MTRRSARPSPTTCASSARSASASSTFAARGGDAPRERARFVGRTTPPRTPWTRRGGCEAPGDPAAAGEPSPFVARPQFRSRLAAEVVVAGEAEGKLLRAAEELDARRAETKLAHRRGAAKAESMRVALGEVKAAVEAAVSKMLGGRVVNVVGDVNKVLDDK